MAVAYIDTQTAIHLYTSSSKRISREASRLINSRDLLISPMVYLEFEYMRRAKRLRDPAATVFASLNATLNLQLCNQPFAAVSLAAVDLAWTMDPFDRIIVAQAIANQRAPLITSDTAILENYPQAVW